MKVHLDCFPCFLKQSLIALRYGTGNKELQERILKAILEDVGNTDMLKPPANATTFIHRRIRESLRKDPFEGVKSEYNRIALGLYPSLKRIVEESSEPLRTASRLAIAGNAIDFGIFTSVDIEGAVERALHGPPAVDEYLSLRKEIAGAGEVLYLLDNAGEIVFDKILIETLQSMGVKVTAVVKGSAVINDCTFSDAVETGLTEVCEVADNGSDAVGTVLEWTSDDFLRRYVKAPLVLSKGQANFETLSDPQKTIFYLLQSKCEVVSKELGLSLGSMILSGSRLGLDKKD